MKDSVFIDSDVLLDIALDRTPFVNSSEMVLDTILLKKISAFTSPLAIANIYYIIAKNSTASKAKHFVKTLESMIGILSIDKNTVKKAVESDIKDFEDALQYYCVLDGGIGFIITRNKKDYPKMQIKVLTPVEFSEKQFGKS